MSAIEYRITYRREGGQKQYRIFQQRASATRFFSDLMKATRKDLAPLTELAVETRECGAWFPSDPLKVRKCHTPAVRSTDGAAL